ncbi:MAG: fibronectin type III domain-containing protein [Actinomycetota bacterium]
MSRRASLRVAIGAFLFPLIALAVAPGSQAFGSQLQETDDEAPSSPRFIFGLGDQIGVATNRPIFHDAPVKMITSWYNGRGNLGWMSGYQDTDTMSNWYGKGHAMELVVWLANDPAYAVSDQFQTDIELLTRIFKGNGPHYGPLYVVLFTELETYSKDPAYFDSLRSAYVEAVERIHATYDQAEVGLGFGGYGWLNARTRDLTAWEPAIRISDFVAAQHMHSCNRVDLMKTQVPRAIEQLGSYGKPVFVSHFKFWGDEACQRDAWGRFLDEVWTEANLATFHRQGLRAWGFMDDRYIRGDAATNPIYGKTRDLLRRYASPDPVTDMSPPTAPSNLAVTGVTDTSVSLSWSPSTDDRSVAGYDIYAGTDRATSVTGTSATVTGLSPGTTYSFTAQARDPAGNESSASNAATATTNDVEAELCPGFDGDARNQIVGTPGDDVLVGTPGVDIICGAGGDDVIRGRGGADLILGGIGNDTIMGRAGNDRLEGNRGHDIMGGHRGADILRGGRGNDRLTGGRGRDGCAGGPGRDRLRRCE